MKNLFLPLLIGTLFSQGLLAAAESSFELTCRAKAKETAAEIYRGCISEKKSAEIERLQKSYQEKLRNLKSDYEKEIETLGVQKSKGKSAKLSPFSSSKKSKTQTNQTTEEETPSSQLADESQMDIPEPIPVQVN